MLTRRRTAGLLLALALAAAGCHNSTAPNQKPPPVGVEAVQVGQQPIAEIVHGGGTIFPLRQASLAPKISSPVRAFYASRGQHVHRGQLLAVLENEDWRVRLFQPRAASTRRAPTIRRWSPVVCRSRFRPRNWA